MQALFFLRKEKRWLLEKIFRCIFLEMEPRTKH